MKEKITIVTKKDLRIDTFRPGGNGGQKMQKTSSGVRITHIESGAVGESTDTRSYAENRKIAFRRMAKHPKFERWLTQFRVQAPPKEIITRRYTYKEPHISFEKRKLDRF
jgi:protein subunit release factor B